MKNIQLRLKDSEETVETFDVADGELLIVEAQRGVNYELFNTLSGMAPQNIITKRIDQDLLIILDESEGGGSPEEIIPDIVIRDYYGETKGEEGSNDATGVLVGLHNNGKYYAYVPESSDPNNAVSVLEDNMAEPQAIGGNEVADGTFMPWWALYGAVALFVLTSDRWDSGDEVTSQEYTITESDFDFDVSESTVVTKSGTLDLSSDSIQTTLKGHDVKLLDLTKDDISINELIIDNSAIDKIVGENGKLSIKADENDTFKLKGTLLETTEEVNGVTYQQYDLDGDNTADLLINGITPEII